MARTTIYIPDSLFEKVKDAGLIDQGKLSGICRRAIESEVFGDNPDYMEQIYQKEKEELQQQEYRVNQMAKRVAQAKEAQKKRRERMNQNHKAPRDYRTIIPKGGDNGGTPTQR